MNTNRACIRIRTLPFILSYLWFTGRLHSITDQFFWIGANDQTTEGGWKWTDKTPFAFMNWDASEC